MLEVHSLLINTESRYILNDLYITDYCVWIQSARLFTHMLEVHSLLIDTESRYILNDLYMTDYCVWIQSARLVHPHVGGS